MKTRILIIIWILLPIIGFSQINIENGKWIPAYMFQNMYQVSMLNSEASQSLYYLMNNYIKISPIIKDRKPYNVEFENGEIKKISDSVFCIVPNKLSTKENSRYKITINGTKDFFYVFKILPEKLDVKFSASTSPFTDCITLNELNKSDKIEVSYNDKRFLINSFYLQFVGEKSYSSFMEGNNGDTIDKETRNKLKENIIVGSKIDLNVWINLYDSLIRLSSNDLKVVDSYENEFIRRTIKFSPFKNDLKLMKNDLRIKIIGQPRKEVIQAIKDFAEELNDILETIQVKIVDHQPSITLFFDSINKSDYKRFDFEPNDTLIKSSNYKRIIINYLKGISDKNKYFPFYNRLLQNIEKSFYTDKHKHMDIDYPNYDSILPAAGYKYLAETYTYLKEKKDNLYPFNKTLIIYYPPGYFGNDDTDSGNKHLKYYLRRAIIGLLADFKENEVYNSIFCKNSNYGTFNSNLSSYDKYLLKTLYSKGGEEKIKTIINNDYNQEVKKPAFMLILVLTICMLFVFSEIYNYYNISNFIGKVRFEMIKRIIESVLFIQVSIMAYLIIQLATNGGVGLFKEIPSLELKLSVLAILSGLFLILIDMLLKKIKIGWLSTIVNLILSFTAIALAYQLLYFYKTPEIIKLSVIDWQILMVPLLISLYRLYAGFQTKKISGLLQEKELELSKQKELKFKSDLNALQARINPHFLYNALNSLASLTHIDSDRTEKMALSLSKLFRYNINKTEEHYATLKDEIEMAEIYLQIEKNRFEDKLNYSIDIQEQLSEFIIPRFILQPLAENAVKHGISKIVGKGIIRINIFEEVQKVIIEIYDNGPDFPGGLISGYGLQNTYEKLKLLYKKPFDIAFINAPEKKLVITLTK